MGKKLIPISRIEITNIFETETWFLILIGVLILLISVLCGLWCLCAARNVKNESTVVHMDLDEEKKKKSKKDDRSDAGGDTVIEVDDGAAEHKVRAVASMTVRMAQSFGFLKN